MERDEVHRGSNALFCQLFDKHVPGDSALTWFQAERVQMPRVSGSPRRQFQAGDCRECGIVDRRYCVPLLEE